METKNFLKEPLFEVIDIYFETFNRFCVALWDDIINNYKHENALCSDLLEEGFYMFLVDTGTLKKRISVELFSNPSSSIIVQHYITDKYNTIKSKEFGLTKWGNSWLPILKDFSFPINPVYLDSSRLAKLCFYEKVLTNGIKNNGQTKELPFSSPSTVKVTIGDFYGTIMQELETSYTTIMQLFPEASAPEKSNIDNDVAKFTKEQERSILQNYQFWNNQNDKMRGQKNIFNNVSQFDFLKMVCDANFSTLNKKGISQRVQYNILVLSRLLGNEWGKRAAEKLGKTLDECGKRTEFGEWETLKTMYLQ